MADVTINQLTGQAPTSTDVFPFSTTGVTPSTYKATLAQIKTGLGLATVATTGSYNDLSSKPTIPTAVSQLTNDSGYITSTNSFLSNGYSKVGSLIIQWGQSPWPGSDTRTVTFPLAFPNACLIVVASHAGSGGSFNPGARSWTKTDFTAIGGSGENPVTWIAIGN